MIFVIGRISANLFLMAFFFVLSNVMYSIFMVLSHQHFDPIKGKFYSYQGEAFLGIYLAYIVIYFIALYRFGRPIKSIFYCVINSLVCGTITVICFLGGLAFLFFVYFTTGTIDSS